MYHVKNWKRHLNVPIVFSFSHLSTVLCEGAIRCLSTRHLWVVIYLTFSEMVLVNEGFGIPC